MSLRSSLVGEGAPLLVSGADASLGREAKAAGRRLPAVFACAAVGGFVLVLVCFSVALPGSNHGAPSTAREGFVSDAAVMADAQGRSQTPRKYEHLPDEGFAENKDQATHTLAGDSAIWGNARADEDDDKETSARLGWVPDQAFMKESERLYNQINDAGVTQLDYENGVTKGEDEQALRDTETRGGTDDETAKTNAEAENSNQHSATDDDSEDYQAVKPAAEAANLVGASTRIDMGTTTQPRERLRSPNPQRAKTLRFNPCASAVEQESQWSSENLKTECVVNAHKCNFCAWVLQYDAEYRVNDVVSLLGPNYKVSSQSLLSRPEYKGTILRDMLDAKPRDRLDSTKIQWKSNSRDEASDNFDFVKNRVEGMDCRGTKSDTLLVHLRAGDAVGAEYKQIPDVDAAARRVVEYALAKSGVTKIEISGVLHFGVPDPSDSFYQDNGGFEVVKDDFGQPRYRVTDDILKKNGYIVNKFIAAARDAGLEVWFTSNNNPDTDMCRFAKACHFLSASRVVGKPDLGNAESRMSFSDLLDDLHWNLRRCD